MKEFEDDPDWLRAKAEAELKKPMDENLRLVIAGMGHIDARIKSLQAVGLYANAALTAILLVLLFK